MLPRTSHKNLSLLALLLSLSACVEPALRRKEPEGKHVDPMTYAAEYTAVVKAMGESDPTSVGLKAIQFLELSPKVLLEHCGDGALACAYLPQDGLPGIVFLPAAEGPCDTDRTGHRYFSDLVMHEIAHALGYNHGPEMDELLGESWLTYLKDSSCDQLADNFLAPPDRPRTLAAKALLDHTPQWVSLHPSTHALSGVATLSMVGPDSWSWAVMTKGPVLHEIGKFHGSLEDAKVAVESVAREYTFVE